MNHPSEKWRNKEVHPVEIKDKSRRFLDRDIRFASVDQSDEDDLWKCLTWELYRTIAFCGEMPPSLDAEKEFPFYISGFPQRAYLSHDLSERNGWERFVGQREDTDEDRLLSNLGMDTNIFDYNPIFIDEDGKKTTSKEIKKFRSLRSKLPLELYVNPNWTKEKLKSLFDSQIKEIYEEIQSIKSHLEKGRKIIPHVHVDYFSKLKEKEFRQLVKQRTDEVCKIMKSDKKYFELKAHEFEQKNKSLIATYRSRLKHLGHYRLLNCVGLSWSQTKLEFGKKDFKPLQDEKRFRATIRRFLKGLPCS